MFCSNCGSSIPEGSAFCPVCGNSAGGPTPSRAPFSAPPAGYGATPVVWDYATWGTRAVGYLIDGVLVGGAMLILWFVIGGILTGVARLGGEAASGTMCCVVMLLFPIATLVVGLYNRVYLVAQRGYSIGQGGMKIKVVDGNGQHLTQNAALIRLLAQIGLGLVPLLPILDMLWPLWDERRQTLHDKAVSCYVINA
jgi:uncharacterized RDD family membrane protein YckC